MDDLIDFTYDERLELPIEYNKKSKVFAVDKGGSLAKIGYVTQAEGKSTVLRLVTLRHSSFDAITTFIEKVILKDKKDDDEIEGIVTGNVAHLLCDAVEKSLGFRPRIAHEFTTLIRGFTFSAAHLQKSMLSIPTDSLFPREDDEEVKFPTVLATMGSVTAMKVIDESRTGSFIGGCMLGGLFFGSMSTLCCGKMTFEEIMDHLAAGDLKNLSTPLSEISEENHHALPPEKLRLPFQPFAKVLSDDSITQVGSHSADKVDAIMYYIAGEQVAALTRSARAVKTDTVYLGGSFHHNNPKLRKYMEEIIARNQKLHPEHIVPKPRFLSNAPYMGIIGALVLVLEGETDDSKIFSVDIAMMMPKGEEGAPGAGPPGPGGPPGGGPPDFIKALFKDGPPTSEMIEKLMQNPPPGFDPAMLENMKKMFQPNQ